MKLFKAIIILYFLCLQTTPYLFGQTNNENNLANVSIPKSNIYWLSEGHATVLNYEIAYNLYSSLAQVFHPKRIT